MLLFGCLRSFLEHDLACPLQCCFSAAFACSSGSFLALRRSARSGRRAFFKPLDPETPRRLLYLLLRLRPFYSPLGLGPSFYPPINRPFDRLTYTSPPLFLPHFQSVIPAHSVLGSFFAPLLVFSLGVLSSSLPQLTRLLAAFPCLTSSSSPVFSPSPLSHSSTAWTQSVIPAHSVLGCFLSSLPFSSLFSFHPCLDSVGHSGPLGLWLPPPVSSSLNHLHNLPQP